jgi:hypothetical protein
LKKKLTEIFLKFFFEIFFGEIFFRDFFLQNVSRKTRHSAFVEYLKKTTFFQQQLSNMPESSTSVRSVAVVHSTTPSTTNGGGVNFMTKKINLSPFMNVKLEPPGSIGSTTAQDQKQRPRLIHLISATSSTGVDSNNRPSPPNILKRSKPATTVTLAGIPKSLGNP